MNCCPFLNLRPEAGVHLHFLQKSARNFWMKSDECVWRWRTRFGGWMIALLRIERSSEDLRGLLCSDFFLVYYLHSLKKDFDGRKTFRGEGGAWTSAMYAAENLRHPPWKWIRQLRLISNQSFRKLCIDLREEMRPKFLASSRTSFQFCRLVEYCAFVTFNKVYHVSKQLDVYFHILSLPSFLFDSL